MRYRNYFVLITIAILATSAASQPAKNDPVACHRIEDYTTEWFLSNSKPEFARIEKQTCLFYTRGMSSHARELARSRPDELVTIWDVWRCELHNNHLTPDNPLRCIHGSQDKQRRFFENMSRAFATIARSSAWVLHSTEDYHAPPKNGIWWNVERPRLINGKRVEYMGKVNGDMTLKEIFWPWPDWQNMKGITPSQFALFSKLELKKRWGFATASDSCRIKPNYTAFDELDWW